MPVAKKSGGTKRPAAKPRSVKIVVMGSGEIGEKAFKGLLADHLTQFAKDDVTFVLPIKKDTFTPTVGAIGDWLIGEEIAFELIVEEGGQRVRAFKPLVQNATETIEMKRGWLQKIARELGTADVGEFIALPPEEDDDDDLDTAITQAFGVDGVKVFNLLDGLDELEWVDDDEASADEDGSDDSDDADEDADADSDDEDEEEEAPKPKAKAKKPVAADEDDDDEDDEDDDSSDDDIDALADKVAGVLAKRMLAGV